jgi:hypothetical protein
MRFRNPVRLPYGDVPRARRRELENIGEIKFIMPPDTLLKVFALFMLIGVIFILAVSEIIQESTVSALLGAVATGVLISKKVEQ